MYTLFQRALRTLKIHFCIVLFIVPVLLIAQEEYDSRQILQPPSEDYYDFGKRVIRDGETIMVGAPIYGDGYGRVEVYQFKDGRVTHQQTLSPEGPHNNQQFGEIIALDGPVAVIGQERFREVLVYHFDGYAWQHEHTLSVEGEYGFGYSVDISGDRIIVGARANDCPGNKAFIYKYNGTAWELETILEPEELQEGDDFRFGWTVLMDRNRAAVTAPTESHGGDCRGTIHTYEYNGSSWQETDLIWICDFDMWGYDYGYTVVLEEDLLAIGNTYYNNHQGAIEVLRRMDNQWVHEERIVAEDPSEWGMLGYYISIGNDIIIASEGGEASDPRVMLFKYERNHWQQKYVFMDNSLESYGYSVCLDEHVLLIGAPNASYGGFNYTGVVDIYELIAQPYSIRISDGTATNRVKINWSASSDMAESYKIYRDGEEIATTLPGARSYNDYDAVPGMVYDYSVTAYCKQWGETLPQNDYGWRLPEGRVDGSVQTRYGAGVPRVELKVEPVDQLESVLNFNEETDYTLVRDFEGFPDTALTVSFWLKSSDIGHDGALVSFCSPDNDNEFLLYNHRNLQVYLAGEVSAPTGISVADGQWHHIAVTWRQEDGAVSLYTDGQPSWQGTLAAGDTLSSAGYLVLGQDQDKPGGGFQTDQAFIGMLDDFRLWKTALSQEKITADMSETLTGKEKNLTGYWSFDDAGRGPEDIIPDLAAGGGHHMQMMGTELSTVDDAPVAYRTWTDPYGDFSITNLYYENSREFSITPSKPRHGFDPSERRRTLDMNNPTMTAVSFTDTTSFTIAGLVVQRFGGSTCYVQGVEIWLNGTFMGVKTDANGAFIISVEEAGLYRIRPKFREHTFEPAEMLLDVNDDIFDLEFIDTSMNTLSGFVQASCQTYIGQADLRIVNENNPAAAIDTTITTDAGTGYFEIVLPARTYLTELTSFTAEDPLLVPRPDDVVEFFGIRPVDLTDSSRYEKFTFRKAPVVEISGWPEIGCAPFEVPILEMGVIYPLRIEVYEEFGGERCLVDTGKVTIYDDVGTGDQDPVVLDLEDGVAFYDLTVGEPNILSGGLHPYQKLFQVEADVAGMKSSTESWVLVTGHRPREQTFATVSPDLPFMILRDPPGDASYCYVEEESELRQTLSFTHKTSLGVNTWMQTKLGCKMNLGWIAETVVEVWGSFRNAMEMTVEEINQYEYALSFKSSQTFTTSDQSIITGEGGDVFMGAALNLIYALTDVIEYDADSCKVDKYVTVVVGSEGFATNFIYTENHIRNVLIPQLEQLRDIYEIAGSDSAKIYANQIDVWTQTLELNRDLKEKAVKLENRSFSAGAKYEYSNEISVSSQSRVEFNLEIDRSVAIEAGAEIGGSGVSGGVEIRMGMGMGLAQAIDITQTNTTGYVFDDDDVGDFFSVDIKKDPAYGTPVFDLVAGRSSCPWEQGSQPRDGVALGIDSHVKNYVPADEAANFILSLGNTSQSDESREYHLRFVHGSNPDGAIVKVSGVPLGNALSYFIPAGEQFTASMTVERGPLANDYANLQLMMYPPCEYEFWRNGANLMISDTVTFSVHFESPESQISLILPEDNWVINQTHNDSLQILIGDYNLNNPHMENIKFQYRRAGEGWTTAYWVLRKDIDPEYTTFFWDVSDLPDGNYELRAVNDCGSQGVNYSPVAAGIIDRRALIVMDTPQPADGILNLGENIAIRFSGDIDCGRVDPEKNVRLTDQSGNDIAFELACYRNELVIIPEEPLSTFENQMLTARVSDIRGESGNVLRSPVSWSFRVSINPVYWSVSNVSKMMYQNMPAQFERALKNAGSTDESFSITRFPSWLTPDPQQGSIPPGGEQVIVFTLDTQLNVGAYSDTVFVDTDEGLEFLLVRLNVLKTPPAWSVNPAQFANNMNITGRLVLPDGISEDEFDMVSAFVDGECRGYAQVSHIGEGDQYLVYLTVYSNLSQGEAIGFRIWDASEGREYERDSGDFIFQSDGTLGSVDNPVIIEADGWVHAVDMQSGWNWFSVNVKPEQPEFSHLLQDLTPSEGDVIKGQYAYVQYDRNIGWVGSLYRLETGRSYRMFASEEQRLRCVGGPVILNKEAIPVNKGWTWIGFPAQRIMDVNEALDDFAAYPGDRIKSQTAYAEYAAASGAWEGSLTNLVPGEGYMIKSAAGGQLNLPVLEKADAEALTGMFAEAAGPDWELDAGRYEYTMSLTGSVIFDRSPMNDTSVVVGAFSGDECRGLGRLQHVAALDRCMTFMMVYSDQSEGDTLQFRVYDPAVGDVREVTETVVFSNDAIRGTVAEPAVLTAEGIGDELVPYSYYLNQNYPNPFNPETVIAYGIPEAGKVTLEVYTVLGQKVATLVNEPRDAGRYEVRFNAQEHFLANGLYFYRLKSGDFHAARKFLVIK